MLSNAVDEKKVTFAYVYQGEKDRVPNGYKVISGMKKYSENYAFLAIENPSEQTKAALQIKQMPILLASLPVIGQDDLSQEEKMKKVQTAVYNGKLKFWDILDYVKQFEQFFPKKQDESKAKKSKAQVKKLPVRELNSDNFDDYCDEETKNFCGIAFLNSIPDVDYEIENHKKYLETLSKRNNESSGKFRYMWVNATCHPEAVKHFDISQFVPTIVYLSPGRGIWSRMVTSFSEDNIAETEKTLESGRTGRIDIEKYDPLDKKMRLRLEDVNCQLIKKTTQSAEEDALD